MKGYEPRYILAYKKQGLEIGVTFFDIQTLQVHVGQLKETDDGLQSFRTLICQTRPVEVIQEKDLNTALVSQMLKNAPVVPTFTNLKAIKCPSVMKTCTKLEGLFGQSNQWPQVLQEMKANEEDLGL